MPADWLQLGALHLGERVEAALHLGDLDQSYRLPARNGARTLDKRTSWLSRSAAVGELP